MNRIMYLANFLDRGRRTYRIRQSHFDSSRKIWDFHDVFDLGEDPARYIHRFSERVVYFDEALEGAVEAEAGTDPTPLLERLLWDFLPPEERKIIREFSKRAVPGLTRLSAEEQAEVDDFIHIFDRRRMFFIRYGAVDQSRIYRLSDKLYRPLLFKSRDEKEFYFRRQERSLRPGDLKKYIFAIFNLQEGFRESFSAHMPEALDPWHMETLFLERLCALNEDRRFWAESEPEPSLRQHLVPYLIYYFDYDFETRSFEQDFYRSFRASHRKMRWPEKKVKVTEAEVSELFGRGMEELRRLGRRELARLFRERAKAHHPDSGGEAEDFIKLRQLYEQLKSRRS